MRSGQRASLSSLRRQCKLLPEAPEQPVGLSCRDLPTGDVILRGQKVLLVPQGGDSCQSHHQGALATVAGRIGPFLSQISWRLL